MIVQADDGGGGGGGDGEKERVAKKIDRELTKFAAAAAVLNVGFSGDDGWDGEEEWETNGENSSQTEFDADVFEVCPRTSWTVEKMLVMMQLMRTKACKVHRQIENNCDYKGYS